MSALKSALDIFQENVILYEGTIKNSLLGLCYMSGLHYGSFSKISSVYAFSALSSRITRVLTFHNVSF